MGAVPSNGLNGIALAGSSDHIQASDGMAAAFTTP